MKRVLARRPSPALVIACIALFVSLGGVSYGVATGFIDSREILDGRSAPRTSATTRPRRRTCATTRSAASTSATARSAAATWRFNTLTGADINESRLAQVPDAAALGGVRRRGLRARGHHGLRACSARPRGWNLAERPRPRYDVDPLGYVHLRGAVERDSGPNSPLADAPRRGTPGHRRPLHRLARGRRAAARGAHRAATVTTARRSGRWRRDVGPATAVDASRPADAPAL